MTGFDADLVHQRIGIVDDADAGDGVHAHIGAEHQRLGVGIGNAADAHIAVELDQILFKLGAKSSTTYSSAWTTIPIWAPAAPV